MDIFIPIFILFTIFVLCSLCGFCCKNRNEGAIFSSKFLIISLMIHSSILIPNQSYTYAHSDNEFDSLIKTSLVHFKILFLAPVVITSQTHQPVGSPSAYPIHGPHVTSTQYSPAMPMPYSDNTSTAPYPTGTMPSYPSSAPYPTNAPYPPTGASPYPATGVAHYPPTSAPYPPTTYEPPQQSFPPSASSPYPPQIAPYNQAMINQQPPAYNEVVFNETNQKQAPYNPNFTG